jgi:hypothetical protein
MSTTDGRRWVFGALTVVAAAFLLIAMGLCLYLLADPHHQSQDGDKLLALLQAMDDIRSKVQKLEVPLPPPDKQPAAETAYLEDRGQHELLLDGLRNEHAELKEQVSRSNELLKEAKETEDRTRGATSLFLGIFGAVAAILSDKATGSSVAGNTRQSSLSQMSRRLSRTSHSFGKPDYC